MCVPIRRAGGRFALGQIFILLLALSGCNIAQRAGEREDSLFFSPLALPLSPLSLSPPPLAQLPAPLHPWVESFTANTEILGLISNGTETLLNIAYDTSMVNYQAIIVAASTQIVDKAGRMTTVDALRQGLRIKIDAVYRREPQDIQPYRVYALRIAVIPDEELAQYGHGGPGYLMRPTLQVLAVDPVQRVITVTMDLDGQRLQRTVVVDDHTRFLHHVPPFGEGNTPAAFDEIRVGMWLAWDGGRDEIEEIVTRLGDVIYFKAHPQTIYLLPNPE